MPTYTFGCNGESHNFGSWDELLSACDTLCPAPPRNFEHRIWSREKTADRTNAWIRANYKGYGHKRPANEFSRYMTKGEESMSNKVGARDTDRQVVIGGGSTTDVLRIVYDLSQEVDRLHNQVEKLHSDLQTAQSNQNTQLASLHQRVDALLGEMMKFEINGLELDEVRKELAELKAKDIQPQLDEVRKELAELKAKYIQPQLDELRKELAEVKAKDMQPQLDELRKELAELRQPRRRRFRFCK